MAAIKSDLTYSFPAIRGTQAGRAYYVAMMRLSHVVKIIPVETEAIPEDLKAQRQLNKARIPAIARYMTENPKGYVFSSLTVSVGGRIEFEPVGTDAAGRKLGQIEISADTPIIINDGQHRRAAIERAIEQCPELARETISVVFFVDTGLKRSQQMFADLNRYTVRPTNSINILYDHRDPLSQLVHRIVESVEVFRGTTEKARTTISNRSRKMFTLSSVYQATKKLLNRANTSDVDEEDEATAAAFWTHVSEHMPDWLQAARGEFSPAELRRECIHTHGLVLQALATVGRELIARHPDDWSTQLKPLRKINWRKNNPLWEGRAIVQGHVSKSQTSVQETADVIRKAIGLKPNTSAQDTEVAHEPHRV